MKRAIDLRAYAFVDSMQPQYAALIGTVIKGDVPVAGMADLFIEVAPGSDAFTMLDIAVKQFDVKPGFQLVEREFGQIELHSFSVESVKEAGRAILESYGLREADRIKPRVVSTSMIHNVNPYQAQLINRFRQGSLLVPSESLFIMEVEPASYIVQAVNEAEKFAAIKVVHFDPVGRYGRLFVSGSASEVTAARDVAVAAVEAVTGVPL